MNDEIITKQYIARWTNFRNCISNWIIYSNKWNYYGYTSYGWTVFVNQDESCFLTITGDGLLFYSSIKSLRQNDPMLELLRSDVNDVEIMCDILNSGYIDNKYIMAKHNNDIDKILEKL